MAGPSLPFRVCAFQRIATGTPRNTAGLTIRKGGVPLKDHVATEILKFSLSDGTFCFD
jgi:hypothetical protein